MFKLLNKLLTNLKNNAVKILAGVEVTILGAVYLYKHDFFFYPPAWSSWENSPVLSVIAFIAGIGLVIYGLCDLHHKQLNLILLCLNTIYVASILAIISLHVFGDHQIEMVPTLIGVFSLLALIWIASYRSDNRG